MNKDMNYNQVFVTPINITKQIMTTAHEKCINDSLFKQNFLEDPTDILEKEGLKLHKGFSFRFVTTVEEANSLPDNVIPLSFENKKEALSLEDLQKIAGGGSMQDLLNQSNAPDWIKKLGGASFFGF